MSDNPAHVVADALAEVQAMLHDHYECGKYEPAEVLGLINGVMSERSLIQAMYDVGYFPASNPPDAVFTMPEDHG
jgi:tRNA isopentenyl-2-thiomethyl-A-37 hydroxylase MiaE